ncbi:hypothetical protein [Streptomyces sp. TLI_171]|uniref:hypothetical protein n=1 Tax=Streptomyces sp. TLI_171 TaxID=1938859 RepID=UPI000C603630|nr:hypothetical protein [Streptomyces sp. TLI_171]RKE18791.1 hypothetical protein BX266_2086 [Streptomyces sp. TLI_171]
MSLAGAVRRSVPAVALLAVLAGCSASSHHDVPSGGASLLPGEGPVGESAAAPEPAPSGSAAAKPFNPSDWPTEPAPASSVQGPVAVVVKAGYSGEAYLQRLATAWGVTMEARAKVDFPGRPTVWHQTGRRTADGSVLSISATWTEGGDLELAGCTATVSAPKDAEFLADCARLDYPGADPTASADWVQGMLPRLHSAFETAKGAAMDSPLRQAGPVGLILQEGNDPSKNGDYRAVYLFGTGRK